MMCGLLRVYVCVCVVLRNVYVLHIIYCSVQCCIICVYCVYMCGQIFDE